MSDKKILDACCGGRMFWFDKQDERVLFEDNRNERRIVDVGTAGTKGRAPRVTKPNILTSFTNMPYPDESFWHIVFDPPHLRRDRDTGIFTANYGVLNKQTWKNDLQSGFAECFRVLKTNGTLIFKWNEIDIPLKEILALTPVKPLYGHRSGKKAQTHWVAFIKTTQAESPSGHSSASRETLAPRPPL